MKNRTTGYSRIHGLNYFFNDFACNLTYNHFMVGGTLKEEYIKYIEYLYEK